MIKFNNGNGAIICNNCGSVIKNGFEADSHVCEQCKEFDNFEQISDLIQPQDQYHFYFCQIIKRKKDGNRVKDSEIIKSYYFHNSEELYKKQSEIIQLCQDNNARAYINLNVRNRNEILVKCIQIYSNMLIDKCSFHTNIFDSCCGECGDNSTFLIDIDGEIDLNKLQQILHSCRGNNNILLQLKTPNGYHWITNRFDRREFSQKLVINKIEEVTVKDNSPTLLYYKMK